MRPKRDWKTGSKASYDEFKEDHKDIEIDFMTFKKVLYRFNDLIMNHLLETGARIRLPYGLGALAITKYKPVKYREIEGVTYNNLPIDWKASREAGKLIRTLNLHTNGYKFYFAWFFRHARIKCSFIWKFSVSRTYSRKLASLLKDSSGKYKNIYYQWINKL